MIESPTHDASQNAPPAPQWRSLSGKARLMVLATKLVVLLVVLELASRAYWQIVHRVPAFRTSAIWNKNFPMYDGVRKATETSDPGTYEVLLLGPSVLYEAFGNIADRLEKGLASARGEPVRVSNLSYPGHTSRDAVLQYRRMGDRRFDLVLFYHGINDHYLNNIPADRFEKNYAHASRYRHIAALDRHPEHPYFVFPYTVRYIVGRWEEQLRFRRQPGKNFLAEGENIKTVPGFRANVEEIAELAQKRKSRLALATFAYFIPPNYTDEAFKNKALDYDMHFEPVKVWGTATSVPRAIDAHNAVIREVAAKAGSEDVILIDTAARMPGGKGFYHDPCHFNEAGAQRFTDILVQGLVEDTTFRTVNRTK